MEITTPLNQLRQHFLSRVMAPDRELQEQLNGVQERITRSLDATFQLWGQQASDEREKVAFRRLADRWVQYNGLPGIGISETACRVQELQEKGRAV